MAEAYHLISLIHTSLLIAVECPIAHPTAIQSYDLVVYIQSDLVLRFWTICGSKLPLRSRGAKISKPPKGL